ncbi:MAG: DEAD/DEAH box helicase family protein [Planctomycetes bacterium]|nr:DEAD/DEAH box helicase family protein [Planctomycetota bacterium]
MPSGESNSEWLTRKRRIDPKLDACGWRRRAASGNGAYRLEEYETAAGPADYALCIDSDAVGIIEAKKLSLGPQNVLTQAQRYSRGATANSLCFGEYRVPFLYSTNGEVIWFHDVRHELNRSRRIAGFHTPGAFREMMQLDFDAACERLRATPNSHPRLRPYQVEANTAVEAAIAARKREMLVAMATGTGKTFTMVNQVYRLMKARVARRVLFLVDRRALAAQAVRAFKSFEPEPALKFDQIYELYSQQFKREDFDEDEQFDPTVLPANYLLDPNPDHAFVYVCTIQRLAMNLFGRQAAAKAFGELEGGNDDAETLDIPIHAFDLIIADECHRGYTGQELSVWRDTLNHFDAIRLGLTATPAAHTTAYFGSPVFRYDYRTAVLDSHLVDYDIVKVHSDVRLKGIFLQEGEQVGLVDTASGAEQLDRLEDERTFEPQEVERKVTSPDSNRKIIEKLREHCAQHEQRYGRFPKTLIFAAHDLPHVSHADQLVSVCRDVFGRGDAFVQKITGRVDRPLQRIREFRNRQNPGIVVSVDLMSTGVDIPDLEIIVFLRPVGSRILFEQMLGRGTRKGEKHPDKSHFTVFDGFGGTLLERFKQATAITADEPAPPSRTYAEIIDDIWHNRDRDYNVRCLAKRLQRIDKEMSGDARTLFGAYVPDGDLAAFAKSLREAIADRFNATMQLLRDPAFQKLLVEYPRKRDSYVVAIGTQDMVTTEWFLRDGEGRELKPADYLEMFAQFVRDNPTQIEAIRILLDRPRDWGTQALIELRTKLSQSRERFTPDMLQKAHEVHYRKALVDIISMVKHAADEGQPLFTAEERVARAFAQLTAGHTFTGAQQAWLDRIREHLIANLSIDREDFDDLPVFSRNGGWTAADRDFEGRLLAILEDINGALAA